MKDFKVYDDGFCMYSFVCIQSLSTDECSVSCMEVSKMEAIKACLLSYNLLNINVFLLNVVAVTRVYMKKGYSFRTDFYHIYVILHLDELDQ
jgi:hypothetical protein